MLALCHKVFVSSNLFHIMGRVEILSISHIQTHNWGIQKVTAIYQSNTLLIAMGGQKDVK